MRERNKISLFFLLTVLYVILLTLAEFYILDHLTQTQTHLETTVNISGSQRMLSQRVTLLAGQLANARQEDAPSIRKKLEENLLRMERNHAFLTGVESTSTPMPASVHKIYFEYGQLDHQTRSFTSYMRNALNEPRPAFNLPLLERKSEVLLDGHENATQQFLNYGQEEIRKTRLYGILVLCGGLAILFAFALLIFRPLLRDISSSMQLVHLLQKVAASSNEAKSLEAALQSAIEATCQFMKWSVGHAYMYEESKDALVSVNAWYLNHPRDFDLFRKRSDSLLFPPGYDLIGKVYSSGEPVVMTRIYDDPRYERYEEARICGLETGFAFPIRVGDTVVGVLEFYSEDENVLAPEILEAMANIGTLVGRVAEREQALEHAKLLEALIRHSTNGIILVKAGKSDEDDPEIIFVNDGFTASTGYSAEDIIGHSLPFFDSSETDPEELDNLKESLKRGLPYAGELRNSTKSGAPYWLSISSIPIRNEEGDVTHYALIQRDITQQKDADAQRGQIMTELKRANKKAEANARDLYDSLQVAEDANRGKAQFLAKMNHEIRTAMQGIMGMTYLLLETELGKRQEDLAKSIYGISDNLLVLLSDAIDFSRIQAGELKMENVSCNITAIFNDTVKTFAPQAKAKGVALQLTMSDTLPSHIMGDPARLRQIVTNLVSNAVKFTDKGTITVLTEHMRNSDGEFLYGEVRDTGAGMEKAKLENILGPSENAASFISLRQGGSGLGLIITRQLTRLMGGTIGIKSAPAKGTTAWFMIPIEIADAPAKPAKPKAPGKKGSMVTAAKARVLLADDSQIDREFTVKLLEKLGISKVDIAETGNDVLQRAKNNNYDLILMDCQMPQIDGFEATRIIREREAASGTHTPIIALTASAMPGDRDKCLQAGMDDYLSKPLKLATLKKMVGNWLLLATKTGKVN